MKIINLALTWWLKFNLWLCVLLLQWHKTKLTWTCPSISQHLHIHDRWARSIHQLPTPHSVITCDVIVISQSPSRSWLAPDDEADMPRRECLPSLSYEPSECTTAASVPKLWTRTRVSSRCNNLPPCKKNCEPLCHDLLLSFLLFVSWHETQWRGRRWHSTAACCPFQFQTQTSLVWFKAVSNLLHVLHCSLITVTPFLCSLKPLLEDFTPPS